MEKNHIEKVWVERQVDEYVDTSDLGTYTNKKEEWSICRHCGEFVANAEKGNLRAEEIDNEIDDLNVELYHLTHDEKPEYDDVKECFLQHNIIILEYELARLELHECPHTSREYNYFRPYAAGEPEGTEDFQTYGKQDFKRMEGLNNGNWYYIDVIAKAEIRTSTGIIQVIRSGGLGGVESDAGECLDEVGKEELESLSQELTAIGFSKRAIDHAFENVETIDKY